MSGLSHDVSVRETNLFGELLYRVYVDGVVYDKFFLLQGDPLTERERTEIAWSYYDALSHYQPDH